jgi:hypothetical protein
MLRAQWDFHIKCKLEPALFEFVFQKLVVIAD